MGWECRTPPLLLRHPPSSSQPSRWKPQEAWQKELLCHFPGPSPEHRVPPMPRGWSAWEKTRVKRWLSGVWGDVDGRSQAPSLTPATRLRVHHNRIALNKDRALILLRAAETQSSEPDVHREHSDHTSMDGNLKLERNRIFAELPTQLYGQKTLKIVGLENQLPMNSR